MLAEMESYKKLREEIVSEHKNSPHLKYWLDIFVFTTDIVNTLL